MLVDGAYIGAGTRPAGSVAGRNESGILGGPAEIKLIDQAKLALPEGYAFIPAAESRRLLTAMGNGQDSGVLGMIFPGGEGQSEWFMVASYRPAGYIKDDDAKDWNADDLLKSIKEGTAEDNKERRNRGMPEMEIAGWVQAPTYDAATHRLVWSLASRDKGASANAEQGVNYNTLALGRQGYISLNLVTDLRTVESEKPIARQMLSALKFDSGKAYEDFNSSTDKVAEYGLAALVAGVAAKKLGFFALAAAFFLKFAKLIAIGGAALVAGVVKLFKGKKSSPDDSAQA